MVPTHIHITEYADPVLRPASPASSLGTAYGPDETSLSDSELPSTSFEKKCLERLELHLPRKDEQEAERDPLITIPLDVSGKSIWVGDEEAMKELDSNISKGAERVIASLSSEISRLRDDDLYEQTLLRGSKAALEPQPSTNDIDGLMRSMMGPGMDIGSGPYMGRNSLLQPQKGKITGAGIVDGPWNNFGHYSMRFNVGKRESRVDVNEVGKYLDDSTATTSTIGKRSRNGTSRNTRKM